jgi:alkanesulfonate monooxygenase SsuD/methylene tetrahydromethanopterin reductase-like flavin-dependent oxidoreductase (luciferase family)
MAAMITDEMVETFVVSGTPEQIAPRLQERYGDIVQRVSFDTPGKLGAERVARVIEGFRATTA